MSKLTDKPMKEYVAQVTLPTGETRHIIATAHSLDHFLTQRCTRARKEIEDGPSDTSADRIVHTYKVTWRELSATKRDDEARRPWLKYAAEITETLYLDLGPTGAVAGNAGRYALRLQRNAELQQGVLQHP